MPPDCGRSCDLSILCLFSGFSSIRQQAAYALKLARKTIRRGWLMVFNLGHEGRT